MRQSSTWRIVGGAALALVGAAERAQATCPVITVSGGQTYTNAAAITDCNVAAPPTTFPGAGLTLAGNNITLNNTASITGSTWAAIFGSWVPVGAGFQQSGILGSGITINNSSLITSTASDSTALMFAGGSNLAINNLAGGTISATGAAIPGTSTAALGFNDYNGTLVNGAVVNNAGSITAANGGTAISVNGAQNVSIVNQASGVISSTGSGGLMPVGILFGADATSSVSNATIQNAGTISSANGSAIALGVDTAGGVVRTIAGVTIINTGQVIGGANPLNAGAIVVAPIDMSVPTLAFSGLANVTGLSITNTGTINGAAIGIAIDNSRNIAASTINNSGSIDGSIMLGRGGDTLVNTASGVITTGITPGDDDGSVNLNGTRTGAGTTTIDNAGIIRNTDGAATVLIANAQNVQIINRAGGLIESFGGPDPNRSPGIAVFGNSSFYASPGDDPVARNISINNAGRINGIGVFSQYTGSTTLSADGVSIVNSGQIIGGAAPTSGIGAIAILPMIMPDRTSFTGFGAAIDVRNLSITNTATGLIDGTASAGIAIDNSRNVSASTFTSAGTIRGNVLLGRGGDTLTFTGGTMQGNVMGQGAAGEVVRFNPGAGGSVSMIGNLQNTSLVDFASGTTSLQYTAPFFPRTVRLGGGAVAAVQGSAVLQSAGTLTTVITGDGTTSGAGSTNLGRLTATGSFTMPTGLTVLADLSRYSQISHGARYVLASGTGAASVGSISALSSLPIYQFSVLRGDQGGLGQSANDIYLVASLNPAGQSALAPEPQMAQARDNQLRAQTFEVVDEAIAMATSNRRTAGRVDLTPEFGIWTSGRLGSSKHAGYNVMSQLPGQAGVRGASTSFDTTDQSYMAAAQLDLGRWMQFQSVGWRLGLFGGYGTTDIGFQANTELKSLGYKGKTANGANETGFAGMYTLASIGNLYGLVTATGAMGRSNVANSVLRATGKYETQGFVAGGVVGTIIPLIAAPSWNATSPPTRLGLDLRVGASYSANQGDAFTDTVGNKFSSALLQAGVGTATARLFYAYNEGGMRFTPFAQLGYNYRFLYENEISVDTTRFRFDDSRNSIYASTGVEFGITDWVQMNINARGEKSAEQTIYSGALGLKIVLN